LFLLFGMWGCGMSGGEWRCPYCDGACFIRNLGTKLNANVQRRTCFKLYANTIIGLEKLVICLVVVVLSHKFSLIFCGSRLEIWNWSCMLSFWVFSSTISLIYNYTFKGIWQVSIMVRFWRERILEKKQKREIKV
jgi:hypothetical protein